MKDSIRYKWNSGKPCKAWFFTKGFLKDMIPNRYYQWRKESLLRQLDQREDKEYILKRVAYYNKVNQPYALPLETRREHNGHYYVFLDKIRHFRPSTFHKAYYLDLQDAVRYFDRSLRIAYTPGDVYFTPTFPTLVKSRLLKEDNHHSVILKLDKLRHFMFVNDWKFFGEKKDKAIFRGKIRLSRQREQFLEMYFGSSFCDCGVVDRCPQHPEWETPKKTIQEHLDYKFILALEDNDVASNLK